MIRRYLWAIALLLLLGTAASAATPSPVIFFSDITRGPVSGNTDTTYSATGGVYVTLYGNYLDAYTAIKLNSVSCITVVSGPSPWMWYERMVVKLGTTCTTGNWSITTPAGTFTGPTKETVLEGITNDFTVASGNIYYISTSGNDSTGTGSFSAPWQTPYHAKYQLADGDVMYGENGLSATTTDPDGLGVFTLAASICGTSHARTFATYPGATVTIGTTSLENAVRSQTGCAGNYTFSGITFRGQNVALDLVIYSSNMTNIHVVGTDISCPSANAETGCIQDGGNTSPWADSSMVYLGNNMHDVGTGNSGLQHGIYHGDTYSIIDAWNTISNVSGACRGIQVYTSTAGFLHKDIHIHDNIIHDTGCDGIGAYEVDASLAGNFSTGVEIYNNVIYNTGETGTGGADSACVYITAGDGYNPMGTIEFYNNTLYNCEYANSYSSAGLNFYPVTASSMLVHMHNNIIYPINSLVPYYMQQSGSATQLYGTNNLMYGVGVPPVNANLTGTVNSNPNLVNTSTTGCPTACVTNLALSGTSTAAAAPAGSTVTPVPTYDLTGYARPSPPAIGAYEFVSFGTYYAQTALGAGNGNDCADALAYNDPTNGWLQSAKQQPGAIIHVCGTITFPANTNAFNFVNSGTSGSPITLKFEPGAVLSSPYWPGFTNGAFGAGVVGAVTSNTHDYVVVDGGTNGVIQATGNGTSLANQKPSYGVYMTAGTGIVVKNLTVANMYIHVCNSSAPTLSVPCDVLNDGNGGDSLGIIMVGTSANPLSATITNCTTHDTQLGILISYSGTNAFVNASGSVSISHNTQYNENIHTQVGPGTGGSTIPAGSLHIFNNSWGNTANWDDNGDNFHHNPFHLFAALASATLNNPWVYNNVTIANLGWHMNSGGYIEETNGGTNINPAFFNNVVIVTGPNGLASYGTVNINGTGTFEVNNTILGYSKSQSQSNACVNWGTSTSVVWQNNTCSTFGLGPLYNSSITYTTVSNNNWYNLASFGYNGSGYITLPTWQTATGGDASPPTTTTAPNYLTTSPFTPQAGSPLIGAGANLTSSCSTYPPLCQDINGVSRPSTGAWDVGAAQFKGTPIPGVPGTPVATVTNSNVALTWNSSSGTVVSYSILRGTASGGPYTQVGTSTTPSFTDTNLAANTYYYVIQACNSSGCSANSGQASATVLPAVVIPSVPTGLAATAVNTSQINLTWTASTGTPTGYHVLRATVSGGPYTTIATLGTVTSYSDTGLTSGTTYYYVVNAFNSAGTSANSTQASATTVASLPVANLTPSGVAFGSVVVGTTSGTQLFTLTNQGNAALVLASSSAVLIGGTNAGDFAVASTTCTNSLSISPGGSCTISVDVTPSATGTRTGTLTITSNVAPVSANMTAVGTAGVTVTPTSLTFPNQYIGSTSAAMTATVTNLSGSTITFTGVTLTTGTKFTLSGVTCSGTLTNGSTCVVGATFTPTSPGSVTDTINIAFTGASGSPIHVSLSGNGSRHKVRKGVNL